MLNCKIKNMLIILSLLVITSSLCHAENLTFFQNEYDVTMDIARIVWFNTSFFRNAKIEFVLYNRTQRVFNASYEQLINADNNALAYTQVYKMMSNEYRIFPVFLTFNVCAEYLRNTFGAKNIMSKITTNIKPCDQKKGFYYAYNVMPDFSKFPPHLPRGSYKIVTAVSYHTHNAYTLELYGKIKDKPVDWQNIPKRNWD